MLERDREMHAWKRPCNACLNGTVQCMLERDRAMHAWKGPYNKCLKGTVQCMLDRDRAMHAWKGPCNTSLKGTVQYKLKRDCAMHAWKGPCNATKCQVISDPSCSGVRFTVVTLKPSFDQYYGRYRRFSSLNSISFWFHAVVLEMCNSLL